MSLIALVLAGCGSSEDEDVKFSEDTPMFAIQENGVLRIAVPELPPFGAADASKGFSVALGKELAQGLEVEAEPVTADSKEMGYLVSAQIVDIAFPLRPVTYDALRIEGPETGYSYASPYYVAHQRLLVPSGSGVEQLDDLDGKEICSYINHETQVDVSQLVDAEVTQATTLDECRRALGSGRVDAVTASDALLASIQIELGDEYSIVGDQLNTEGYAAQTLPGAMATYVIGQLNDMEEDGRWAELYDKWLEPHLGAVDAPPDLTLQDAAALYPPG
jgi:polar amino acid transport system substrate-binding protein